MALEIRTWDGKYRKCWDILHPICKIWLMKDDISKRQGFGNSNFERQGIHHRRILFFLLSFVSKVRSQEEGLHYCSPGLWRHSDNITRHSVVAQVKTCLVPKGKLTFKFTMKLSHVQCSWIWIAFVPRR